MTTQPTVETAPVALAAEPGSPWLRWRMPLVALGTVFSWVLGGIAPFTASSTVAVLLVGALALLAAFAFPPPRLALGKPVTAGSVAWWFGILGAFTAVELVNLFMGSTHSHPTLSVLMAPLLLHHLPKSVAVAIWLRVGWTLVRR